MFEVLTSEASYLRSLHVLTEHFMESRELEETMIIRDRKTLFSNILRIREVSERWGKKGWREIRKKQKLQSDLWCEVLQGHLLKMKLGQECKACSLWFNRLVHSFLQVLKICYLTQQILERLGGPHISGRGVLWHLWYNKLPCPAQLPRLHWLRTQPDLPGKDVHWAHVSNQSFTWIRFKLSENFHSNYEKGL